MNFDMKIYIVILINIFILNEIKSEQSLDTREGEDFTLKCRFDKQYRSLNDYSYFWTRLNTNPLKFDNIAINKNLYDSNYKLNFNPEAGQFDLIIKSSSYFRDNAQFECRIKTIGSGRDIHYEKFNLTVLVKPKHPKIENAPIVIGTEDKSLELKCSAEGGSPKPEIMWYRDDKEISAPTIHLVNDLTNVQSSLSTISIIPKREDDGAKYQCLVWNRALEQNQQLESTIVLNIQYYPRVKIGPANPLKIERDSLAKLECKIDAKPEASRIRWTRNGRLISSLLTHTIQRVSIQDAGKYTCSAENGLGKSGEQELVLDVLYAPMVNIEKKVKEVKEGDSITIQCSIVSNPKAKTVEWVKDGNLAFHQNGDVLTINNIQADDSGTYFCRAINFIETSDGRQFERMGNASVTILVRHRPGQAEISPEKPIVHVGNGITLVCSCKNPGWPMPKYRWFRDILEGEEEYTNSTKALAEGYQYVIIRAHLGTEGKYHCVAENELGTGDMATVELEVHQPPQFLTKLPEFQTRRKGDTNYAMSCSAKGKPKPTVKWLKDDNELSPKLYDILVNPVENPNGMHTVQSTLRFLGMDRPGKNQLIVNDRGHFTCLYENEVDVANSTMFLRIEHGPIVLHQYNKVAFDIREKAEILCRVKAYPRPEFQWFFGNLTSYALPTSNGHYEIHSSSISSENTDNIYTSVLTINQLQHSDYGEYYCRITNSMNSIKTLIRLQQKGPPEHPTNLTTKDIGSNYAQLQWDRGFDGGLSNTKFFISYRRIKLPPKKNEEIIPDCSTLATSNTDWMEFDCQQLNPCRILSLDQYQSYAFKVRAMNTKGRSDYSNEILTTTKVTRIPQALHARFDWDLKLIRINVGASCLPILAVIENLINHGHTKRWEIIDSIPLQVSGNGPTFKESLIKHFGSINSESKEISEGLLNEDETPKLRLKLCLKTNHENCGDYIDVEIFYMQKGNISTSSIIAIIVSGIVFILFAGLVLMFCRFKRKQLKTHDQEASSVVDHRQLKNQAPPPYYLSPSASCAGLDNNGLEHTIDLQLDLMEQEDLIYSRGQTSHSQNGILRERVNSTSQDSVWQVKMSAAAGQYSTLRKSRQFTDLSDYEVFNPAPSNEIEQNNFGNTYEDPYLQQNNNFDGNIELRSDFCSASYAAVLKPKKSKNNLATDYVDSEMLHNDLTNPYLIMDGRSNYQIYENQNNFQQINENNCENIDPNINYDENDDYVERKNRNRRVIREIVV